MGKFFILFCSCLAFNVQAFELSKTIDSFLESPETKFNGIILITQKDKVLYQKGNENAQYLIGSLSKQITAALVLQCVDASLIELEAPIIKYLPDFKSEWATHVTVHHLLNHTSGITKIGIPLSFYPGEKFQYSNQGYYILGMILESVTGKSYAELLSQLCLQCGMNNTVAPPTGSLKEIQSTYPELLIGSLETSTETTLLDDEYRIEKANPSSGILSTALDLWRWNTCLHEEDLLSTASYLNMNTSSIYRNNRFGIRGYGYGVGISAENNIKEITHNGLVPGYTSTLIYYPEQQVSVIILENRAVWYENWGIEEQKWTFYTHDQIRKIIRCFLK